MPASGNGTCARRPVDGQGVFACLREFHAAVRVGRVEHAGAVWGHEPPPEGTGATGQDVEDGDVPGLGVELVAVLGAAGLEVAGSRSRDAVGDRVPVGDREDVDGLGKGRGPDGRRDHQERRQQEVSGRIWTGVMPSPRGNGGRVSRPSPSARADANSERANSLGGSCEPSAPSSRAFRVVAYERREQVPVVGAARRPSELANHQRHPEHVHVVPLPVSFPWSANVSSVHLRPGGGHREDS